MKWSLKIGRFAGIDVFVHATFFLILAWIGTIYWSETGTFAGVATGLVLILLLFLCVLLHEYGHALTARHFGVGTRHITLLPIGGVAMLEGMPKEPREEMIVALAGPAVNLVIAAGLFLILLMIGSDRFFGGFDLAGSGLLQSLLTANLMLAVFNLLPAFPMDGGRVLRAVLSMRTDRVRATRLAARIGQMLAIGLGFLGLVGNPFLILIAVFVWIGAGAEAGAVEEDARLSGRPAELAMITDFHVVHPRDPLGRAIDLTLTGTQKDFPVVEDGTVVGVLSQSGLLRGLRDLGADGLVAQIMEPARTAEVGTPLDRLLADLQDGTRLVCVTRNGALVGIVDLENIIEYLRIQAALSER